MYYAVVGVAFGIVYPLPADAQARTWLDPLEVVDRIEDGEGTLFGNPRMIRGSPRGGFVLADWGEHSVREYSPSGELLWRVGRRGEGPGEFSAIMDLEFDAIGNLLVLDRANRVTIVDPSGVVVGTKTTPGGNQILPVGFTSGWATLAADRTQALWTSDSRTVAMPRGVSFEDAIVGERWAANAPDGDSVVFHRWSDVMIIVASDGSVRSVVRGIETIDFPKAVLVSRTVDGSDFSGHKVDPKAVEATRSATVSDDHIFVLFLGETEDAGQIVDTYSRDGAYVGSYRLPDDVRASRMAVLADERLAFLDNSFIPEVVILRTVSETRAVIPLTRFPSARGACRSPTTGPP